MSGKMLERLQRLTSVWGPSGREQKVAAMLSEMIAPFVQEVRTDRYGNLIARREGVAGGKRVLLVAHMDTPGAVAINVSDKGLIYLAPIGGLKPFAAIGQRVVWGSGITGVIQHEPVEEAKEVEFKRLFCDIGATSREEALENVSLGDLCTFVTDLQQLEDLIVAPGLDNRAGCAVLLEVAEHLVETDHEVIFAFTCHGEVGPRGAGAAAYGVEPDLAFVVDTTPSGDLPRAPRVAVRLGGGPALKLKDGGYMAHQGLSGIVRSVAEAQSIPLQIEISGGQSEAQVVSAAGQGVPTAVVDIPLRYRGTAGEMINLRDLYGSADLLLKLLDQSLTLM